MLRWRGFGSDEPAIDDHSRPTALYGQQRGSKSDFVGQNPEDEAADRPM
jgi:hypothetical protein